MSACLQETVTLKTMKEDNTDLPQGGSGHSFIEHLWSTQPLEVVNSFQHKLNANDVHRFSIMSKDRGNCNFENSGHKLEDGGTKSLP